MLKEVKLKYKVDTPFNETIMGGVHRTAIKSVKVSVYKELIPSDHCIMFVDSLGNWATSDSSYLDVDELETVYQFDPLFEIGEYGYVYNAYMGGGKLCKEEVRGYRLEFSLNKIEIVYLTHSANDKTGIFKTPEDFLKFVCRDLVK